MFGYRATGSVDKATRPANTIRMETTAEKIGRSMKNRENIAEQPEQWDYGTKRQAHSESLSTSWEFRSMGQCDDAIDSPSSIVRLPAPVI